MSCPQGLRTGLYTSPHVVDVRERMRINGNPLRRRDFSRYRFCASGTGCELEVHGAGIYFRPGVFLQVMYRQVSVLRV